MSEKEAQTPPQMNIDPGDGIVRTALATVETYKAKRYMKALCNHFNRKVEASYDGNHGTVNFHFGDCTFEATEDALLIEISATGEEMLERIKYVIADHLIRFGKDELHVEWVDGER